MKKLLTILFTLTLAFAGITTLSACGGNSSTDINAITREQGSGTRDAFIGLFGVEEKTADGTKIDHTTENAAIAKSTAEVLAKVSSDKDAIGYISLGSLNDTVKAITIDGVTPSVDTVKDGSYKISRPFNLVTTSGPQSEEVQDFLDFIYSTEGQQIVQDNGYIPNDNSATEGTAPDTEVPPLIVAPEAFKGGKVTGKITICGSSSVSPLMEKLIEAYNKINAKLEINLNTSDSTTGLQDLQNSRGDIAMISRNLKQTQEEANDLVPTRIATDGLAVIVNTNSTVSGLTTDQVKNIFTGAITTWEELTEK